MKQSAENLAVDKKTASVFLGITGSILILICAVALVFFRRDILPSATGPGFNPDSFILLVSGLLGFFGGAAGIAGSALSFWGSDRELSGIMLLGAAVSGAVMYAAITVMSYLVYITLLNRYAALATGIVAFLLLVIAGVVSLTARREPDGEPGN